MHLDALSKGSHGKDEQVKEKICEVKIMIGRPSNLGPTNMAVVQERRWAVIGRSLEME